MKKYHFQETENPFTGQNKGFVENNIFTRWKNRFQWKGYMRS